MVVGQPNTPIPIPFVHVSFSPSLQWTARRVLNSLFTFPFRLLLGSHQQLIFRDITVKGSLLGDPATVKEMVDLVGEKGIEVKTEAYPLEKIEQLMVSWRKHALNRSFGSVRRVMLGANFFTPRPAKGEKKTNYEMKAC